MILKTTTNEFCFINVSFYETVADPRHFFSQEYEEMPEYEEESDFDFDSYCNAFMPYVQEWADEVKERLLVYGVKDIKVTSVGHPREYNYGTDWMESEITEYAYECLLYSDFATTEMLIPEGSEYLFNDVHTAEADELYHHVLDKYGWAWRDPKYKSETELCAMLKWAKEKGLTIEELSI